MRNSTLWRSSLLLFLFFGLTFSFAYAQERTVTGKVTSDEDGPLPGVNIVIQGTTMGAVSDLDGNYSIVVPGPDASLQFSSIGFITDVIKVGNQTVIDLVMRPDVSSLDEVVVTAYATQVKKDLTGSVGVVN
ncbi:MAG: carboxypeptidase-like regulatory domain-containing protein, partial [Bacteroidales bacterium]|nr:carboxypeptidase-like regulatory domain-containing protein [Bacteroidales bacterium]